MTIQPFTLGVGYTNSYLIYSDDRNAVLVDAPDGNDSLLSFINEKDLNLRAILLTHGHYDHILGLGKLTKAFPEALIYLDENDFPFILNGAKANKEILTKSFVSYFQKEFDSLPEKLLPYPEKLYSFEIIRTPGHTMGSVSLLLPNEKVLFSGDTLFHGGIGRSDLGGNYSELVSSLEKLKKLDPETRVFPGHGGNTSIGFEKENNPYL